MNVGRKLLWGGWGGGGWGGRGWGGGGWGGGGKRSNCVHCSQPYMHDTSVVMCGMQNHIRFSQCHFVIIEAPSMIDGRTQYSVILKLFQHACSCCSIISGILPQCSMSENQSQQSMLSLRADHVCLASEQMKHVRPTCHKSMFGTCAR